MNLRFLSVVLLAVIIGPYQAVAQAPDKSKLIVDISPMPPCVMELDGKFTGFDIDVWEAIAKRLPYDFEFRQVEFSQIFNDLESHSANVGLGGITITKDRETKIDFTYPNLKSGLRIATIVAPQQDSVSETIISAVGELLFSWNFLKFILLLLAVLVVLGLILEIIELYGEDNPTLRKGLHGLNDACWCVWAQMTTMGFGDIVPKKILGRILSLPAYIFGAILLAMIVSAVNAKVTADTIEKTKAGIASPHDLYGKKVATVVDSTSVDFLNANDAKVVTVTGEEAMFEKLIQGEVDAVVFDSPAVMYFVNRYSGDKQITMVDKIFAEQYYGIALEQNSPYREEINQALLSLYEDGTYERLITKWFGVQ